jgi:hypothetical protein
MNDEPLTEEKIEEHRKRFAKKRTQDAMKARAKADYAPKTPASRIEPKESA